MDITNDKNKINFGNRTSEITEDAFVRPSESMPRIYSPNNIDFTISQLSIGKILKRLKEKEINISSRKRAWSKTKQSRFIESILVRIPLPSFYFDGSDDESWTVVDGLKRLITLNNFAIKKTLELNDLEYLPEYNKMKFDDLPRDLQRRIEETTVPSYILNPGVPSDFKHSIFKRINPKRFK